jgi:hypothetical protein
MSPQPRMNGLISPKGDKDIQGFINDFHNKTELKSKARNNLILRTIGSSEGRGDLQENAYTSMATQKRSGHSTKSYINARYKQNLILAKQIVQGR